MKGTLGRTFYEIVRDKTFDAQAVTIPQEICSALRYICAESSTAPEKSSRYFASECSTWRLISMLQDDIMDNVAVEDRMDVGENKYKCDAEIVQNLFAKDSQLRHLQVIVDWLQESAGDAAQELCNACEIRWPNPTDFWSSLNDETYGSKVKNLRDLQLDLLFDDCNSLSPALAEDIDLLFKTVFFLLRAGELNRAQDLCSRVGHDWLAAAIGGHQIFEDCPYENLNSSINVGNRNRLLWQSVAWSWLQHAAGTPDKGNSYERAVFGLLCGRLDSILPVAKTWHDRVWACVTTFINIKISRELMDKSENNTECFLPSLFFDQIKNVSSIFPIADECDKRIFNSYPLFERVQRCLIEYGLDNFSELLSFFLQVAESLNSNGQRSKFSVDDLRFCVHMLHWLKVLGIDPASHRNLSSIYVKYISLLSNSPDNVDLAAFYTSQMPKPIEEHVFVEFIDNCLAKGAFSREEEDSFIKRGLFEAHGVSLSIAKVLDGLMRLRLSRFSVNESAVIHALTWYYLLEPVITNSDAAMVDFLRYSNAVIRMFLLGGKNDLAREVFMHIRSDTVTVIAAPTLRASISPEDRISSPNASLVREYFCYKALFLALDRHSDWNSAYTNYSQNAASNNEKDLLEVRSLERSTEELVQATYNVLLFAGPGWLVDEPMTPHSKAIIDANRSGELEQLRRHYIPELTLSLSMCLMRSGDSHRSQRVQLVDALMSSHPRNLTSLFSQQQLTTIARSASCILAE